MSSPMEIGAWVDVPMIITSTPAFLASFVISLATSPSETLILQSFNPYARIGSKIFPHSGD
jgi:hypothetical protein